MGGDRSEQRQQAHQNGTASGEEKCAGEDAPRLDMQATAFTADHGDPEGYSARDAAQNMQRNQSFEEQTDHGALGATRLAVYDLT